MYDWRLKARAVAKLVKKCNVFVCLLIIALKVKSFTWYTS